MRYTKNTHTHTHTIVCIYIQARVKRQARAVMRRIELEGHDESDVGTNGFFFIVYYLLLYSRGAPRVWCGNNGYIWICYLLLFCYFYYVLKSHRIVASHRQYVLTSCFYCWQIIFTIFSKPLYREFTYVIYQGADFWKICDDSGGSG
jgi:hypothetical protein